MGAGRKLLYGAVWIYGAQILTVAAQFMYAAATTRLVGPAGFGAYAIALSVAGLVTLIATGGVSQAVSRMIEPDPRRLRALAGFAALVGLACALFLWVTAAFWANLWGEPAAAPVLELLAVSAFIVPLSGIGTSLMRRLGSFKGLAILTLVTNLVGMLVGLAAVAQWRSASALVVSAIASQSLLVIGTFLLTKGLLLGLAQVRHARHEVVFSANLTAIKVADYLVGNIMKFSVSRWLGSSYFGYWNRADMIATLPFQQVQTALTQAVAPEFRNDLESPKRAHRAWTDMLILISWVAIPLSAVAAIILPFLVPLLFGPGWEVTASLSAPLAIAGGLQTVSMVLSSAVEALGRYRWMWISSSVLILIQLAGVGALLVFKDLWVAMACLIVTQLVRHSVQVAQCGKRGYVDLSRLLRNYTVVVLFCVPLAGAAWMVCWFSPLAWEQPVLWIVPVLSLACVTGGIWFGRRRLPPVALAAQYGLAGRRK